MKTLLSTLFCVTLIALLSCEEKSPDHQDYSYEEPQKVVVAGRIFPFQEDKTSLSISVNRIGVRQEKFVTDLDENGYFEMSFTTSVPTDFWLIYNANFSLATVPNDSLFISWDGTKTTRPKILETLEVFSSKSNINEGIIKYQKAFFSSPVYAAMLNENREAAATLKSDQYKIFADSLHEVHLSLLDSVFNDARKEDHAYNWAKMRVLESNFRSLALYPMKFSTANKIPINELELTEDYYSFWGKLPKIDEKNIISAHAISGMSNMYLFNVVYGNTRKAMNEMKASKDSLKINKTTYLKLAYEEITKNSPDEVWKQIFLTEFIYSKLDSFDFEFYESNKDDINKHLEINFLRNALDNKYTSIKNESEKPTNFALQNDFNEEDVIAAIGRKYKNKTVYIDVWATWCGPCRSEFQHANSLKEELKNQDIVFVYVCIDSDEEAWATATNHFELEGEHFFLTEDKSNFLREEYQVSGVPTYMVIKDDGELMRNIKYRPSLSETAEYLKSISKTKKGS